MKLILPVLFEDDAQINEVANAEYLGVNISNKGQLDKEVGKRSANARWTWGKLSEFWKRRSATLKARLLMHNGLIMAKLVYGLESLARPDRLMNKPNAFHRRGRDRF